LVLANPLLADELVLFLGQAGFAADPSGVLPAKPRDGAEASALVRCLSAWNALHPDSPARVEPLGLAPDGR
jgi:hypothetical protein